MYRNSSWSPLGHQPKVIYTIEGDEEQHLTETLSDLEVRVPGAMCYGYFERDRTWHRLDRQEMVAEYDYYRIHVHGSAYWLVDSWLNLMKIRYSFIESDMDTYGCLFDDSDQDEHRLHTTYGRSLVDRLLSTGLIKAEARNKLTSYQARFIYYAWSDIPGLKAVMPCGSGKTLAAILGALATLQSHQACIVVCPARARRGWEDQVERWTNIEALRLLPRSQQTERDVEQYLARCRVAGRSPVLIVGLELLADYLVIIEGVAPTVVIFDELHRFANHRRWDVVYQSDGTVEFVPHMTASNSREVRGYAAMQVAQLESVRLRLGLTASPMGSGHRSALWSEDDLLLPRSLGQHRKYCIRYCGAREGDYGLETKGHDNKVHAHVIEELKARQSHYVYEVTHSESHGELPETRIEAIYLDQSVLNKTTWGGYKIAAAKRRWSKDRTSETEEALLSVVAAKDSSRKRTWIKDKVMEGLENGGKVVLLTFYRDDTERWAELMRKEIKRRYSSRQGPLLLWGHGGTNLREREGMAPRFAAYQGSALLVGTGGAFGESVDGLQHANLAIIATLPWTPMDVDQWKGRFDRLEGRSTLLLIPIAEGTHDEIIVQRLGPKFGGVQQMFKVEQYAGLKDKLLGIDTEEARDKLRKEAIECLFGGG